MTTPTFDACPQCSAELTLADQMCPLCGLSLREMIALSPDASTQSDAAPADSDPTDPEGAVLDQQLATELADLFGVEPPPPEPAVARDGPRESVAEAVSADPVQDEANRPTHSEPPRPEASPDSAEANEVEHPPPSSPAAPVIASPIEILVEDAFLPDSSPSPLPAGESRQAVDAGDTSSGASPAASSLAPPTEDAPDLSPTPPEAVLDDANHDNVSLHEPSKPAASEVSPEIAKYEHMLRNKDLAVRKYAARKLKELILRENESR